MRRDLWMILILGCLLILLLEAPAALSSVSADLDGPYAGRAVHAAEKPTAPSQGQETATADPERLAPARRGT